MLNFFAIQSSSFPHLSNPVRNLSVFVLFGYRAPGTGSRRDMNAIATDEV